LSTDAAVRAKWGDEIFQRFGAHGLDTIWGFAPDSGLKPCSVYARHCVLAARNLGEEAERSFLEETLLVDRTTTFGAYLAEHPEVLESPPPPELAERYCG